MSLSKLFLPRPLFASRLAAPAFADPASLFFLRPSRTTPSINEMVSSASPSFRINRDDKVYSIAIDLPGVKTSDMNMKLLGEDILNVTGERKFPGGNMQSNKFGYKFNLSNMNLDLENLQANLSNGVLNISAPILEPQAAPFREIPIGNADVGDSTSHEILKLDAKKEIEEPTMAETAHETKTDVVVETTTVTDAQKQ